MVDNVELNPVTVLFQDVATGLPGAVTSSNPLPVTLTSGSTDQDVNLVAVGGTNVTAGQVPVAIRALPAANDPFTKVTVNISTATTTHVVAGTSAQTIRVYKMVLNFAAAQTLNIAGTGGTSLVGAAMTFGAGGSMTLDFDGAPWFTTVAAEGLDFITTTTGAITGVVYYIKS